MLSTRYKKKKRESDRDVTRFLWLKDCLKPLSRENLKVYLFCRVPFGAICSPFLLAATVLYHLEHTSEDVAEKIKRNIYLENVVLEAADVGEGKKIYKEAKMIFAAAKMNLREFLNSNADLNKWIPEKDRQRAEQTKVLGLQWDSKKDILSWKFQSIGRYTKRNILKCVASVFDPLGLITPVTLPRKLFLQSLWMKKYGWDDDLKEDDLVTLRTGMAGEGDLYNEKDTER